MMTEAEKKESRRVRNHEYYMKNSSKWIEFYPRSTASQLGTGNLAQHKLDDEEDEHLAIRRELRRLGLKSVHTKVHKTIRGCNNE